MLQAGYGQKHERFRETLSMCLLLPAGIIPAAVLVITDFPRCDHRPVRDSAALLKLSLLASAAGILTAGFALSPVTGLCCLIRSYLVYYFMLRTKCLLTIEKSAGTVWMFP